MFISFENARGKDLVAGNVYGAGHNGNFSDDPIRNLFPKLGNQSGFRKKLSEDNKGKNIAGEWAYIALQTTGGVSEWPDSLDEVTKVFTYYGDQNDLSRDIYDTKQKGNELLRDVFHWLHTRQYDRIPPFFIFQNAEDGRRDTRFLGLAVPGNPDIPFGEDLKRAVDHDGREVNNYVAKFTILDTTDSPITFEWLQERISNRKGSDSTAPAAWRAFVKNGLDAIKASDKADEELVKEIEQEIDTMDLDGETKQALVNIRVNQTVFRKRLLRRYNSCCLCGIEKNELLRASHIKPWSVSEPAEKLDVDNGFLLCPNHDALFDQGLISFKNDGTIIMSSELSNVDRAALGIDARMKIVITNGNLKYLKYHREKVFKGTR